MTGISYKATVVDDEMRAELVRLIDRMENAEGFYKNVGEHLMNSLDENFVNERAPDGTPWKILSAVTVALREEKGIAPTPMLRITGTYRTSYNYEASDTEVRVGSADVRAAIFNLGGQAGRNLKVTIPARPHVGISADDETEIFAIAQDWLAAE